MAAKSVFALFVLFSFTSSCEAKPENCSEARCKLVPVGGGFASEFRLKSSEKGVRLIYLHLKPVFLINHTYFVFLAKRWVWANTINEPMLSLSYDYGILSLGLLNYQVRTINVSLEDQPSGCLLDIWNASCQDKVVGRALLNVTKHSSGERLHETDVVCVATTVDAYTYAIDVSKFFNGIVKWNCCRGKGNQGSAEGSSIHCDLIVNSSGWFKVFDGILNILSLVMVLYCPAFLLAVPDFIFNFQEECKKEEQRDKQHHRIANRRTRYGSTDETTSLLSENVSVQADQLSMRDLSDINISNVEDGQPAPRISENEPINQNLVYLDDASPITFSTFFGQYTKDFRDLISFNVKLAFLWYCVIPIFLYTKLGLNYTIKGEFFEETSRKAQVLNVVLVVPYLFDSNVDVFSKVILFVPLIMIFFLSPKDFLFTGENVPNVRCFLCSENTSSVGEDMLKHLEKLQLIIYNFASQLIKLHKTGIEKSIKCCTHSCLEKIMIGPPYKRLKKALIVAWVLFCNVFVVILCGVFLGALCFYFLVGFVLFGILWYSPIMCLLLFLFRKGSRFMGSAFKLFYKKSILLFIFLELLYLSYFLFALFLSLVACYILAILSGRFIPRMLGYIILGLVLNADIASPFVTFFVVASTNMYLCYYNLQKRYGEVKQMISQQWQAHKNLLDNTNLSNIEEGTIPGDLFWHICGEKSNSEHKVLQIRPEIYRMLRNMVLILIFLVLVLCSIIFLGSTYNISSVAPTIAVFVSGVIPRLFFKGLTKENSFRGPSKSRMIKEIEKAVKEYIKKVNYLNKVHVISFFYFFYLRNSIGTIDQFESQGSDMIPLD